ncbi:MULTISPECIES: hypothetical protein [unclassified Bradyrhizobium]|uniref:hypothetical protein n=1 Tax=Bradyrhizobium TaxID=374 RepID=UPI0028E7252D|nr:MULTISPECIES: hypothetical protein [unclassified Bradyrhizobium]
MIELTRESGRAVIGQLLRDIALVEEIMETSRQVRTSIVAKEMTEDPKPREDRGRSTHRI